MGNAQIKPHPRLRNKKQVHWKAADRPAPPGKPELLPESEGTPDLVTIRWARPINDGGSPISGYLVEHRRVGSPHWVRATPMPVPFPEITLSGLEPGWRYQFRVSAENAVGYSDPSEISEQITVTFQRSAVTAPKFTQDVQDTVALENDKCEFVVHFLGQPAPKVCWFKDGFEIFSSRRIRILTEYDRSVLTIHQTSLSDEGEIKCTATNRAGHVSSKARLTVEAPPSIRLPRNYEEGLLFEMGEVIRLKVSVVGRPTPLVLWCHNGESIQNDDRYDIESIDKSHTLKITEAQRSDRGEYQIKAVNKLGEDVASFLVTVTDKPSPPGKARVVMALGKSVTLSWTPPDDDGGCKIGNYIVEYYRLGWNVWLKAATSRQLSTRLGDLIEGSEYKFRIKAESPYGISDPSEESDVIFIPDPKRGLIHPNTRGRGQQKDFFDDTEKPIVSRKNKPRSLSTSRAEGPDRSDINTSITAAGIPPVRPKRNKSKSQTHTPETTPLPQRKVTDTEINKHIFDRASLSRDLAYGSPDFKVRKDYDQSSKMQSLADDRGKVPKTPSPEPKASYKVKIKAPEDDFRPVLVEPKKGPSPKDEKKLIREHSATVSGSSEFMLVLYSDENERDHSDMFNFDENSIPPPLSLSAPELSILAPQFFPPLKNSASSTELLHEKAMMRFYQAAKAEEEELERINKISFDPNLNVDIPKIQINSKDRTNIAAIDRRHSLRRKMSAGSLSQQQAKWAQKRYSLKNASEPIHELLPAHLQKADVSNDLSTFKVKSTQKEFEVIEEKPEASEYTQRSFERRPVSLEEEKKWKEEYEESMTESDSDSESDYERFKYEVSRSQTMRANKSSVERETYRPPGGLSGMTRKLSEPFEILSKRKQLPDPNFVPKPILKKADSPSVSPAVSPPSSPTKPPRALSPRPDVILQRNRSKSLAVPVLPPISTSSGDESDEPKLPRNRSFSLTATKSVLQQQVKIPELSKKAPSVNLPSISAVAQITGITAASIVIPQKLLEKKKDEEAARVVADHYDNIVKTVGQRRKSHPQIFLERDELKRAAEDLNTPQEGGLSSKDQTPSKENLSQDSGYQSVSGYRSTFTDFYDARPLNRSPQRTPPIENKQNPFDRNTQDSGNQSVPGYRNTFTDFYDAGPLNRSPQRTPPVETKQNPFERNTRDSGNQSMSGYSTYTDFYDGRPLDRSPQRTPPIETKQNPFDRNTETNSVRKDSLSGKDVDLIKKPQEPTRNVSPRRNSSFSQQNKDKSPVRRASNASSTSARRNSGTVIQLGNFNNQSSQRSQGLSAPMQQTRKTSPTPKPRRSVARSKSPSKRGSSVTRKPMEDSWNKTSRSDGIEKSRKTAPSPMRKQLEPTSHPVEKRRPMLREIMTQTSGYLDSICLDNYSRNPTPGFEKYRQEELLAQAEVKVRSTVDWLTDLAMFAVACWLYLFRNELLAIPVLLIMVYRQLKEELKKRIPDWVKKRLRPKPKE